jgi:pimeloyl-ACP methyl ester carboxylesterase
VLSRGRRASPGSSLELRRLGATNLAPVLDAFRARDLANRHVRDETAGPQLEHRRGRVFASWTLISNPGGLARIRDPFLYIGSRNDWRAPLKEVRSIFRRVGATDKRIVIYPGSNHGCALVESKPFAPRARMLVLRWIAAHEETDEQRERLGDQAAPYPRGYR